MLTFNKLMLLLTLQERKEVALLLIMIFVMALLDMIGVASILPFMIVLTNPHLIETNYFLNFMFEASSIFGVKNKQQFLLFLGISVFVLLIFSLIFKALVVYVQTRFVQMRIYSIGKSLVAGYLSEPYSWFLNRHSAELGKTILSEVHTVIGGGMAPMLDLVSKTMIAIVLIALLILVDVKLTLVVFFLFGIIYGLIFYLLRNHLTKIGKERFNSNKSRFLIVGEAFAAIREIKAMSLEKLYINFFSNSTLSFVRTEISSQIMAQLPRFILEAIAFGGALLLILYQMVQSGNFINALPLISLYIYAGYRLMPALQQIYACLTQLSFVGPAIDKLNDDFKSLKKINENKDQKLLTSNKNITFNENITLKNLYYNYPNTSRIALKNINLSISAKSTVGFVGITGSGKTTIIDIILGLLEAQKGSLEVDGKIIAKNNLRSWQKLLGYVPQQIYLSDDTISANIAFGEDPKNINQQTIEKISKIANMHDFIRNELPEGYETIIGERGVRLSGGQRQRIGIARALYRNPKVLILDEATNALDSQTEKKIIDDISNLKDLTIIIIAHRLNTIKNCDTIFLLDQGQLKDKGTFEELMKNNDQFRNSVKLN